MIGCLCTPWLEHAHVEASSCRGSITFHVETCPSAHPTARSFEGARGKESDRQAGRQTYIKEQEHGGAKGGVDGCL